MPFDVLIILKNLANKVIKWHFRRSVIRRSDPVPLFPFSFQNGKLKLFIESLSDMSRILSEKRSRKSQNISSGTYVRVKERKS
jgi:hypothetical protein